MDLWHRLHSYRERFRGVQPLSEHTPHTQFLLRLILLRLATSGSVIHTFFLQAPHFFSNCAGVWLVAMLFAPCSCAHDMHLLFSADLFQALLLYSSLLRFLPHPLHACCCCVGVAPCSSACAARRHVVHSFLVLPEATLFLLASDLSCRVRALVHVSLEHLHRAHGPHTSAIPLLVVHWESDLFSCLFPHMVHDAPHSAHQAAVLRAPSQRRK